MAARRLLRSVEDLRERLRRAARFLAELTPAEREFISMCGRYGLGKAPDALLAKLDALVINLGTFSARYNIAPTQNVLAVVNDEQRTARELRRGLVPA